jgi:Cu+-exporting ATPase
MDAKTFQPKQFQILHQLKRRIRIFVPGLRGDPERSHIFAIILKKRPEITFVKTVPAIGSVTLYFDAKKLPKANFLILLDTVLSNFGQKKTRSGQQTIEDDPNAPSRDISLAIEGMTCASCALLLEITLKRDPRISSTSVNFASEVATVTGRLARKDVADIISSLGYKPNTMDTLTQRQLIIAKEQHRLKAAKKRFIWAGILSLPVIVIGMTMPSSRYLHWLQFLLSTPVVLGAGWPFFDKAWKLAKRGTANMDSLIAIGVGSAYGYSIPVLLKNGRHLYFEAAAAIISFVLLGRYMEEQARGKAGEAIRKLIDLQPQTATLLTNGKEITVAVDDIKIGDTLLVRPGEKIPTDAEVTDGLSTIDEAMLTGESIPVVKEPGHKVFAGCVNGMGALTITATAIGMDTVPPVSE